MSSPGPGRHAGTEIRWAEGIRPKFLGAAAPLPAHREQASTLAPPRPSGGSKLGMSVHHWLG